MTNLRRTIRRRAVQFGSTALLVGLAAACGSGDGLPVEDEWESDPAGEASGSDDDGETPELVDGESEVEEPGLDVYDDEESLGEETAEAQAKAAGWPSPPKPVPWIGQRDIAKIIKSRPNGGVVWLPNGKYYLGELSNFKPKKPLVLVAQSAGKVIVTRKNNVVGKTTLTLQNVRNVGFVGLTFDRISVDITNSSDLAFWYTNHTIPPQTHTAARRKLCGGGRSPDAFRVNGSNRVDFFGVDIDEVGADGLKVGNSSDLRFVGSAFVNVHHDSYQTGTSAADARTCGHQPKDKFHHSDAIQIFPGGVNRLVVSDSYSNGVFMMQLSGNGGSSKGLVIQRSVLEPAFANCQAINTRVKTAGKTMDLSVVDTTTYCNRSTPLKWQFVTQGTKCPNHKLRVKNAQFKRGNAPAVGPLEKWRSSHPMNRWGCFFSEDVGWAGFAQYCPNKAGFPSYKPVSTAGAQQFSEHACNGAY